MSKPLTEEHTADYPWGVYWGPASAKESRIYTRDDMVRAILAQQWAVAVACMMSSKPGPPYLAAVLANPTLFPSAHDVVEGLDKT